MDTNAHEREVSGGRRDGATGGEGEVSGRRCQIEDEDDDDYDSIRRGLVTVGEAVGGSGFANGIGLLLDLVAHLG